MNADAFVADSVDPDHAALGIHFVGEVEQPIFVVAKVRCDAIDRRDAVDFVDVHGQAA